MFSLKQFFKKGIFIMTCLSAVACSSVPPVKHVAQVDIPRFMGDWYVIACIPTVIEKNIYNAVESYQFIPPNKIATTFTFNKGAPDGPKKKYTPTGYIQPDTGNAVWGMQFIWPFKADYKIAYVDNDYQITVIARDKRDYVWLMSRKPTMDSETYQNMLSIIANIGYDTNQLIKIQND
jgi:apolipoprotein D and lipocalin family protein